MRVTAEDILVKQPYESLIFTMPFSTLFATGEEITTVDAVASTKVKGPAGSITVHASTNDTNSVSVRVDGGVHEQLWRLEFRVQTNQSNKHEIDGLLQIKDRD